MDIEPYIIQGKALGYVQKPIEDGCLNALAETRVRAERKAREDLDLGGTSCNENSRISSAYIHRSWRRRAEMRESVYPVTSLRFVQVIRNELFQSPCDRFFLILTCAQGPSSP